MVGDNGAMTNPLEGLDPVGRPKDWERLYRRAKPETLPWTWPDLDPDLARALARLGLRKGRFLDIGTGPGTQAMALARLGFDVTATDLSKTAVAGARRRAKGAGLAIDFRQDDILASKLRKRFDVAFDRGCFHVFPEERRARYALTVHRLLAPGGTFFLKVFSNKQPGTDGPHRFTPAQLRAVFGPRFDVVSIRNTVYQGTMEEFPKALFCVLRPL